VSLISIFWLVLAVLQLLIVAQAFMAYRINMLTVRHMTERRYEDEGLPFINHMGMWGDFLAISYLVATLADRYWHEWTLPESISSLLKSFCWSAAITSVAHTWYAKGSRLRPEAHAIEGKRTGALGAHTVLLLYARADDLSRAGDRMHYCPSHSYRPRKSPHPAHS
jgi:hypothetical protein